MSYQARRRLRRLYLTQHQARRRALLKAAGAKRVEVTLRGPALDHYAIIVRRLGNGGYQRVIDKALEVTAGAIIFSKES